MKHFIKPPALSTGFSESGKSAKRRFDNILSTKVKKTGGIALVVAVALIVIVGALVACDNINNQKQIQTNYYSITIPDSWETAPNFQDDATSYFRLNGKEIGGIDVRTYNPDNSEPIQYSDNHSEIISAQKVEGFTVDTYKIIVDVTPPAASGDTTITRYVHYYIIEKNKNFAINLYFDNNKVSEKNMLLVAKSITIDVPASDITRLYELKGTYVGDNSKVRRVVDLANFTDIDVQSAELQTDNTPYRITVNYKVDSRANYRFFDYRNFDKTAAIIFALVSNVDEINFWIFDDYSSLDEPDTSFAGAYYNRQNMSERGETEYFNDENVRKATQSLDTFTEYVGRVSNLNPYSYNGGETGGNAKTTAIYAVIGDDSE